MTEQRGTSPLVLVVDDDPGTRMLAAASLRQAGYAIAEAGDGDDGISAFRRLRPDLVLLDVVMPRMDGFIACREIRRSPGGERVPILMMTGLDDLTSIHRAYEVGATDFVLRSSTCSTPTERRTRDGVSPTAACSSGGMSACVIVAGWVISDSTPPTLSASSTVVRDERNRGTARSLASSKEMIEPGPSAWEACSFAPGWPGRPG
jgi:CheY-like chemotaxis protein